MMAEGIEAEFHKAMVGIYDRANSECGYNPTRFLSMVAKHGGLDTAHILLRSANASYGYVALWKRARLDLTVEALVIEPRWTGLFADEELRTARQRLLDYGYIPQSPGPRS